MNQFEQFPALIRRLGVPPRHLVHVGAHEGQEMQFYLRAGFRRITLVEPILELARRLTQTYPDDGDPELQIEVLNVACSDRPGEATLHLMPRSNMSTLLPPTVADRPVGTVQVKLRKLVDIAPTANVLVVDAQGAELDVLRGANLAAVDLAVVETCTVDDPTMAAPYDQVVAHMAGHGFDEVDRWVRSYGGVYQWARGRQTPVRGEVRDVVFARRL